MALFDNVKTNEQTAETSASVGQNPISDKKAKKQEKRDARKSAIETILKFIADEKNKVPAEVLEAAKTFKPSFFGIVAQGGFEKKDHPVHVEKLFQLLGIKTFEEIKVGATFDEMKAFQTLKVGRGDMHKISVALIKKPDDKGAVYMSFDANKGIYKIEGIGAEPEGWTGYRPSAKDEANAE